MRPTHTLFPRARGTWLNPPWWVLLLALTVSTLLGQSTTPPISITNAVSDRENDGIIFDEDGDSPGLIVIRNNTPLPGTHLPPPIDISGWYLSNDATDPFRWQFPDGTRIAASASLGVFASGKDRRPGGGDGNLHTNFTYPCDVPYAGLYNPNGALVSQFSKPDDACETGCRGIQLFSANTTASYLVPPDGSIETVWMQPGYSVKSWPVGPLGIGYDSRESDPFCDDLILHMTMDEADIDFRSNIVRDVSGPTVHDGTATVTPSVVSGQIGGALVMEKEQRVVVKHHTELDPGMNHFSVAIWAMTFGDGDEMIAHKGGLSENSTGWALFNTGKETMAQVSFGSGGIVRIPMPRLRQEVWTHLAFVLDREAKVMSAYQNGVLVGSEDLAGEPIAAREQNLLVGNTSTGSAPFQGQLDDFAIWGRVLSESEIQSIFSNGRKGETFDCGPRLSTGGGGTLYAPLIGTDVTSVMRDVNPSIYIRVPFTIPDPALVGTLDLLMQYDDGFICYLNGEEVARRNAPSTLLAPFDATSVDDRPDADALTIESISLTGRRGLLVPGTNWLAIHGLNSSADAPRFVIKPQLCLETVEPQDCEKTTNGRDFWVTFPGNAPEDTENPLELTLCIAGFPTTAGRVEIPGLGFSEDYVIPSNGPTESTGCITIKLPKEASLERNREVHSNGVHVTANRDVSVYGTSRIDYSTDTFLALPTGCLGRRYVGLAYANVWNDLPILNGTQIAFVGVFDGTRIQVDPGVSGSGGGPFEVRLDRGETYMLRDVRNPPADLSGVLIDSNFPVGVFSGHRCGNINGKDYFFCDILLEQLLPVSAWGTEYVSAPLQSRVHSVADGKGDTLRIVASRDNSFVNITDNTGSNAINLAAGEVHEQLVIGPAHVTAEFSVLAALYSNSSDFDLVTNSDPFMAQLQPVQRWMNRYLVCTPPTLDGAADFEDNYVNIIARSTADASTIQVNGAPVAGFQPVGTTGFVYARVKLTPAGAQHLIESGRGARFGVTFYGFSEYDSYGYPGSMYFDQAGPPIVICPPETEVEIADDCEAVMPDLRRTIRVLDPCDDGGFDPDPQGACFDFEDLDTESVFGVETSRELTDSATGQTITMDTRPFTWANGQTTTSGTVTVRDNGSAGHTGNDLQVNNILLHFKPTASLNGFSILFGEYGGNINFEINDDFRNLSNFSQLNGATVGGAQVTVINGNGNDTGEIRVVGRVDGFSIGGQELFVDHLCINPNQNGTINNGQIGSGDFSTAPAFTITQVPAPGTPIGVGEHSVVVVIREAGGRLIGACETKVIVNDRSPIVLTCPSELTALCGPNKDGARVFYDGIVALTEKCGQSVPVRCEPPSGSFFPLGVTSVKCQATGPGGDTVECSFDVRVTCDGPSISVLIEDRSRLRLMWPGGGVLETATEATGPWRQVSGASSPHIVEGEGERAFFRVRF